MRKITLLLMSVLLVFAVNAQQQKTKTTSGKFSQMIPVHQKLNRPNAKNTRAIIWTNDFSTPADWTIANEAGNTDNWVIGTAGPAGSFPIDAIASTSGGNFALFDSDALCSRNQVADITTANNIDLTGHPAVKLTFEQFYRRFADSTFVLVSTDGTTWTKFVVNADVDRNASTTNPLLTSIDISSAIAASPSTVKIRFQFYSPTGMANGNEGCGYAWMIDNVNIIDILAVDAEVVSTTLPDPNCGLTATTPVKVSIKNAGASAISSFPVTFVKGVAGTPVTETVTATIAAGATYDYTFTAGADFSVESEIDSVRAWVNVTGDLNNANDTSAWALTVKMPPMSIPYTMGFEETESFLGWSILDNNNDASTWGFYQGPAHTGTNFAAYKYSSTNAADDWMVTTCIDLAPGTYAVSYYYRANSATFPEAFKVAYGTSATAAGLTNVIGTHTAITDTLYQLGADNFTIATAGTYYFGFQATSDANMAYLLLDDISIDVSNGVVENTNEKVSVYPNPANNRLYIDAKNVNTVEIFNLTGARVASYGNQNTINISDLAQGTYLVKVITDNKVSTQKINIVR